MPRSDALTAADLSDDEARETDHLLVDLMRRRHMHQVMACRLMYRMSQDGYRVFGFTTFRQYLRSRQIPLSWGMLMKGLYLRLSVQLGLPESEWMDIPVSRLQGSLKVLTPHNVKQVLADARVMTRVEFKAHVKRMQGKRFTNLRGVYRLVPAKHPDFVEPGTRRALRGRLFASHDDTWFVELYE